MITPSRFLLNAIVDSVKDHAVSTFNGALDLAIVMLYTGDVDLTPRTVLADLTEATFDGYARSSAVVWGTTHSDASNEFLVTGDVKQFTADADDQNETITGYAVITPGGSPKILFAANLDTPVNIRDSGDAVVIIPQFGLGAAA